MEISKAQFLRILSCPRAENINNIEIDKDYKSKTDELIKSFEQELEYKTYTSLIEKEDKKYLKISSDLLSSFTTLFH
ncbi:hypothetical protein N9C35_02285 [Flavobacteriaceae bacterium]|nr:hypothetical protein [Flavobacteriaceae bacterium]